MRQLCCFLVFCTLSATVSAQPFIGSVSPEFPNGVHARYLQYLATQLEIKMVISPMPLARRIKELEKGNIDIIVLSYRDNSQLIFVEPPYNSIDVHLFVREQDKDKINNYTQLSESVIGHSISSKIFPEFDQGDPSKKVAVSSLKQKILLLQQQRIDGFFHVYLSTKSRLEKMGLQAEITRSHWQPKYQRDYYFVISEKSRLLPYQKQLGQVISQGRNKGEFKTIRQNYYQ